MLRTNLDLSRTVFALSTGSLPSAVAVVKLAGPDSFAIGSRLFVAKGSEGFSYRRGMYFGKLVDLQGEAFDEILLLAFIGPDSHTGDDILEFHCHGSVAIVRKLETLFQELGASRASKGELTYRALLNGKITARGIETLGDVFLAKEESDLRRIYGRRDDSLEMSVQKLRSDTIRLQAILDTAVDFSEEYASVLAAAHAPLEASIRECSLLIRRYSQFKSGSEARRFVLAGRPNAGKSSLFNAILGRYRVIVHAEAGTTRDVVEEDIQLGGDSWKLVDTAGVRASEETREQEGIALGESYLSGASAWALVVDGTIGISQAEETLLEKFGKLPHVVVWNKSDLDSWRGPGVRPGVHVSLSARTGTGLGELSEVFHSMAKDQGRSDEALPSAVQSTRLAEVLVELESLQREFSQGLPPEILGERNREVLRRLEAVTGEVTNEEVLGRLFGEFCIGK